MRVRFGVNDVGLRHSADHFRALVGDAEIALGVLSMDHSHARITVNGTEEKITFAIDNDKLHLARAGQSHTLTDTTHAPPARSATP